MKIILEDSEFQKMAAAWVYENLVDKTLIKASVVNNVIELDVLGEGEDRPETPIEEANAYLKSIGDADEE